MFELYPIPDVEISSIKALVNELLKDIKDIFCDLVGKSVGLSYSWSCCAGGWRFESGPWHNSRSFPSNQETGKVCSAEYAI